MSEKEDFSIEESEELISKLKTGGDSHLPQLQSTLRLLARVPALSHSSIPPVFPSELGANIAKLPLRSKTHRTVITSILAVGILASASLAAAAVTGHTPAPLVTAIHKSADLVRTVAGAVSNAVTGNNSDSPEDRAPNSTPEISNPSNSPEDSPEKSNEDQGKSDQVSGSDGEGLSPKPIPDFSPSAHSSSSEKKKSGDERSKLSASPDSTPSSDSDDVEDSSN